MSDSPTAYKGAVLTRAFIGHWNVTRESDGGFCGGFATLAEAKRWVDSQEERAHMTFVQVGPSQWRMVEPGQ